MWGRRTGITVRKTIFFAVWYSIWTLTYWIFYVASRPGLSLGEYLTAIMPIAAVIGLITLGVYASLLMPTWVAAGVIYLAIVFLLYDVEDVRKTPVLMPGFINRDGVMEYPTTFAPGELNRNLSDMALDLVDSFL